MPKWKDMLRFLDRNGKFLRDNGNHYLYLYNGHVVPVSKGSGEISYNRWRYILKHELCMTQEEFNRG